MTDQVFVDDFFSLRSFIILVIAEFDAFIGRRLICTNVTHYYYLFVRGELSMHNIIKRINEYK